MSDDDFNLHRLCSEAATPEPTSMLPPKIFAKMESPPETDYVMGYELLALEFGNFVYKPRWSRPSFPPTTEP